MKELLTNVLQMNDEERRIYIEQNGTLLIDEMLKHIGYPEDELRDKLNYRLFIELLSTQVFSKQQMKHLTLTLIENDFLFFNIGEKGTDSVFTRSFSALWLTGLLYVDAQVQFLTIEEAMATLHACSPYLNKEKDVRGFLENKGWALAITHGADLSTAIVSHPSFELKLAPILLEGIKTSLWKEDVFTNDEEERFIQIIEKLILREYPESILIEWVEQVFDKLEFSLITTGYTPSYFAARTNTLHFMKSLYFQLKFTKKMPKLMGIVSLLIAKWMKQ
ncbi:hypothetical protein MTP04_18570 [Lysinibacillus sp. PLM2]|nr:hypothetical protein MTP04_18570 [Lysinibacillus sp. PLM2]